MPAPAEPVIGTGSDAAAYLLPVAARIASGEGSLVVVRPRFRWVTFELVVLATAGAGATLDVFVQQSLDGVNYDDLVHFTQVPGTSGEQIQSASLPVGRTDAAGEIHAWRDAALPAGYVADIVLGRRFRIRWTIAGAGASFTFGVAVYPREG
jgi:hypothetical protein